MAVFARTFLQIMSIKSKAIDSGLDSPHLDLVLGPVVLGLVFGLTLSSYKVHDT